MKLNKPMLVSLTGADDKVPRSELVRLSHLYPFVEWSLLYYLEKEGKERNPSKEWREKLLSTGLVNIAAHLCGKKVFNEILDDKLCLYRLEDLHAYSRIQININARHNNFSHNQVLEIYRKLYDAGLTLILQHHEG